MGYRVLADLVVIVHLAFVVFVVLGGLLVLYRARLAVLHVPAAIWGAAVELGDWQCPLTPLENWLRVQGGEAGYTGGFVERYLLPVLYPDGMTRSIQLGLGILVLAINVLIYGYVILRARSRKRVR